jgi:hypothetical protein
MSDVSYQAFLADAIRPGTDTFVPLGPDALATTRKEADRALKVRISKPQAKWLEQVEEVTGKGIDTDAIVRALIDLGRELDIDWAMTAGAPALRDAMRDAVRVRRPAPNT